MVVDILKEFGLLSSAKVNWSKSEALLLGQWVEGVPSLPVNLNWRMVSSIWVSFWGVMKSWRRIGRGQLNGLKEGLKDGSGYCQKCHTGVRVLIINNLVASSFWHRLACIDPPPDLLQKIQSVLGNF